MALEYWLRQTLNGDYSLKFQTNVNGNHWDSLLELLSLRKKDTLNAEEDVGNRKPLYCANIVLRGIKHFLAIVDVKMTIIFKILKIQLVWLSYTTLEYIPENLK